MISCSISSLISDVVSSTRALVDVYDSDVSSDDSVWLYEYGCFTDPRGGQSGSIDYLNIDSLSSILYDVNSI